ncbi:MAG TPA: CaiB/BaiF CoA-transferase family protein [Casimicrobiaceae bacterium]|nr:CaiB/BaiF CoA-transferase family protein [Casimicrobiaceae bacterium]
MPSEAPLAGVRVLDFTRLLPGPACTLYLADLGADVVKIEDTGAGDYARALGADGSAPSVIYRSVNRGKRSLAIDLKTVRGRECVHALAARADIVVESFRPGVMAAFGLDHATLCAHHPRLVYASISGYGQTGPRAAMAGHDVNYLGYAGVLDQTGVAGGTPALSNLQIADLLGGAASAAVPVLAALAGAARHGRGAYVDVAMSDAVLAHQHFALQALARHGRTLPRGDDLLTGGVPAYGVYATADGRHVAVGALEAKFWRTLCRELDRDDLADKGLATGDEGVHVRAQIAAIFAAAPLAHWTARFADVDCCVTPVATLEEALDDPQFHARSMVGIRTDGSIALAPPWHVDTAGAAFASREAPAQGEHSREVLREAGYSEAVIDALAADGVIRTAPDSPS